MAVVSDKDAVKEQAQWRRSDLKERIDAQTREDPGASYVMDGGDRFVLRGLRANAIVFRGKN